MKTNRFMLVSIQSFRKIRMKQGYSLTGLAKAMGVSPATVLAIERQKNVHPSTASKACKALGLDLDDLFVIKPKPSKQECSREHKK